MTRGPAHRLSPAPFTWVVSRLLTVSRVLIDPAAAARPLGHACRSGWAGEADRHGLHHSSDMTLARRHLLAVLISLSSPAGAAAQATSPSPHALRLDAPYCARCVTPSGRALRAIHDSASSASRVEADSAYAAAPHSSSDRAVIGAMIGGAAGAALGAVISSGQQERAEGLSGPAMMLGLGLAGALVGAIGGLLSR
jgi:hypothetical protein